ncbi:MAG TPA: type II secretion system protein [Thermoanaerobaculia bacterium]|nr:type II secretion system protein [Thermoanaerobaculia bacterium]
MSRRGFTLLETTVVLMIGVIVSLSLWPLALELLRRQQGLTARVLTVRTFALLHERLGADFAGASSVGVEPLLPGSSFRLTLFPREPDGPEVVWNLGRRTAVRTERRTGSGGAVRGSAREWQLDGSLSLRRDELLFGRCVIAWEPDVGPAELLAFVPEPRAREAP